MAADESAACKPTLIEVTFLLLGKRFELPQRRWADLGALQHVKEANRPYVDNINFFECGWGFRKKAEGVDSLDLVVKCLLARIWPYRDTFSRFRRANNLKVTLDCYVKYSLDRPLVDLSVSTVKKMAALDCSIGIEVLRLSAPSD